jgi:hypothetical protein
MFVQKSTKGVAVFGDEDHFRIKKKIKAQILKSG